MQSGRGDKHKHSSLHGLFRCYSVNSRYICQYTKMRRLHVCRRSCFRWSFAYAFVFVVLMPFVGQDLVYSVYRSARWSYDTMKEKVVDSHSRALLEAEVYLRTLELRSRPLVPDDVFVDVAIVVVTSRRVEGSRPLGYLTRTVAALSHSVSSSTWRASKQLLICDVNAGPAAHIEADRLRKYFHVVVRFPNTNASAVILDPFEKEKQDYAFCLQQALQLTSTYVLIVEDDAVARDDLFLVLPYILYMRTFTSQTHPWSHLKLYYPERWQGFSFDIRTALELTSFFCITYVISAAVLGRCFRELRTRFRHAIAGGLLVVLLALSIGRQHFIELKRISPYLYSLAPDPACCSPAVLYNAEFVESLVPHLLHEVRCSSTYPLDMALNSFVNRWQWPGFCVEPNLFRHIGLISTMKGYSRYIEDFLM